MKHRSSSIAVKSTHSLLSHVVSSMPFPHDQHFLLSLIFFFVWWFTLLFILWISEEGFSSYSILLTHCFINIIFLSTPQNKYVMAVGVLAFTSCLSYIVYMNVTDDKRKDSYVTLDEDGGLTVRKKTSRWYWKLLPLIHFYRTPNFQEQSMIQLCK